MALIIIYLEFIAKKSLLVYFSLHFLVTLLFRLNINITKLITIATISISKTNPKILELNYVAERKDVIYDVCDSDGSIRLSGKLNFNDSTTLDLSSLNNGRYTIFIIDQGEIYRKVITI